MSESNPTQQLDCFLQGKRTHSSSKALRDIFAVVLAAGLMLLLHKYFKLVRAFVSLQDVVHCNRKPADTLTKKDIDSYIVDLIEIHEEHGAPYGPMIKLSHNANIEHSFLLNLAERFVLCHELGHYLNGDLADGSAYSSLPHDIVGKKYEENRDHEIEYRADITGFSLYLKSIEKDGFRGNPTELVKPILATFNLLRAIGAGASSTHPDPYDRVGRIVHEHYGHEAGELISKALRNPALLPTFFEQGARGSTRDP